MIQLTVVTVTIYCFHMRLMIIMQVEPGLNWWSFYRMFHCLFMLSIPMLKHAPIGSVIPVLMCSESSLI